MNNQQTIHFIQRAGIIARLPGDLPLADITPLADALLASPIEAVELVWSGDTAVSLTADLRERSNGRLLIGAYGLETDEQANAAAQAGVHYISCERFCPDVLLACREYDLLYVPGIISIMAAQRAWQKGAQAIRLRTGGPDGPGFAGAVVDFMPELAIIVDADVQADNVGAYAETGATAVIAGSSLIAGAGQTMADIITRARVLQSGWRTADGYGGA
ncbi:MAG TPA: hypothetical protein EYP41_16385 [Anaerolineae bacterium]|nr:hypothetical protein [Anaerolineae bacterium]HIP71032.1 hypothetical protein [Anaerolineae bacterium]